MGFGSGIGKAMTNIVQKIGSGTLGQQHRQLPQADGQTGLAATAAPTGMGMSTSSGVVTQQGGGQQAVQAVDQQMRDQQQLQQQIQGLAGMQRMPNPMNYSIMNGVNII